MVVFCIWLDFHAFSRVLSSPKAPQIEKCKQSKMVWISVEYFFKGMFTKE